MGSNDEKHFGFVEALVGRARKTLFTDPENTSESANGKPARSGKPRSSRGRSSTTSSLANIETNQGHGKENKAPAAIGGTGTSATVGPGKCEEKYTSDKRRSRGSLKQSGICSLSACHSSESSGHVSAKNTSGRPRGKRDNVAKKAGNDLEGACDRASARVCRDAGTFGQKKGRKRGGRGKHQTSSLIVHIDQDTKRAPKVSSLMALPASTQKTQKSNTLRRKEPARARGGGGRTASSTLAKGESGDSVSDLLNKLSIEGEEQSSACFTPSTIRNRTSLTAGTITSPPAAQRHSTLSDNGFVFSVRSPMPDLNPKKRFDSKKTPDCKFLQVGGSPMDTSLSPMSPSMDTSLSPMSPSPREGMGSPVELTQTSDHVKRSAQVLFSDEVETFQDEANDRRPGSAVLEVEAPTPRLPKRSEAERPKVHLEGFARSEESVVESAETNQIEAQIVCKPTEQSRPFLEDDGNATHLAVRRSARESKKTDRLTVSSWRGKKKLTSNGQDNPHGTRETSDHGVACTVESGFEQLKVSDGPTEELGQADSSENNDGAGMRRSARESKQTDRLTVTWRKSKAASKSDHSKSAGDGVEDDDEKTPEAPEEKTAKLEVKGPPSPKEREPEVPSPSTGVDSVDAWSADEVRRLRSAQKEVDPTSVLYWHEVARIVGNTKSPSECQRKWQCTIATPKPRRREPPDQTTNHGETDDAADGDDEDDLFNSTPLRLACDETAATSFANFNMGEGGCQFSPLKRDALPDEENDEEKPLRKGYNKYISNLRKDIKKKGPQPTGPKANATASKVCAEIDGLIEGNVAGEDDDSCDDDIWDDLNEDTE